MRRLLMVIFGMLLIVPFVTAQAIASSTSPRSAPINGPEASPDQEETPFAACPANRLCLYSGPNYTGTELVAASPDTIGCGELVQPARSIINNSDTFFFVHSDAQCGTASRYIEPYSSDPNLGILARSLLYYCPFC